MNKFEQIRALKNGDGVQYLLDTAYKILRNPITMFDTTYALQAYTNVDSDDPIWNELVSTGTFSMKTQEFFANECFTEDVANADKLVVLKSNKLKYDRILGNVYNRDGIKVSNIVMVLCENLFGEDDAAAFEALVDKITNEIQNDEYFAEYGKASHEMLINDLLDLVINDPKIYTPQVQILYNGFEDYLYVAVVDVKQNKNNLDFFKSLLESKYPSFKFAIYPREESRPKQTIKLQGSAAGSGYIVMIMSSKSRYLHEELFLYQNSSFFEQNSLFVGVSSSFENLYELRKYYDQAVDALKKGMEKNTGERVFLYDIPQ